MSITMAALLTVMVSMATAKQTVSYMPATERTYMSYSSNYIWHVYSYHGKEYIYTYSTCSTPPTSIEVCLSTIFGSIEAELALIDKSLKLHEASLHGYMAYEASFLQTEVVNMNEAKKVAHSVEEAVSVNYNAEQVQIKDLQLEMEQIKEVRSMFDKQLGYINKEVNDIEVQYEAIYEEYEAVKKAHWSLASEIKGIQKEKVLVVEEQADVQEVVQELYLQVEKIEGKIAQMNKRQVWMANWENKLSADLREFVSEVNEFKNVEQGLVARDKVLKEEQISLYAAVEQIEEQIMKLKVHYQKIEEYLEEFAEYEKRIQYYQHYVSYDATEFEYAYSDFTCEEYLLYQEACASSAAAPAAPAKAAPAKSAPAKSASAKSASAASAKVSKPAKGPAVAV